MMAFPEGIRLSDSESLFPTLFFIFLTQYDILTLITADFPFIYLKPGVKDLGE